MCRSRGAAVLGIAAIVAALPLAAQGLQSHGGIAAGFAMPLGDFHAAGNGEGFNTGWQGMALVAFQLPSLPVGFRVDATYSTHSANDQLKSDLTRALGRPSDEQAKFLGANVDVTYPFASRSRVKPYVLGGIGAYHTTFSVTSGDSTVANSGTTFAWNLGAGMLYRTPGVALFLEARYVAVAAISGFLGTTFLPLTAGVRFGGP